MTPVKPNILQIGWKAMLFPSTDKILARVLCFLNVYEGCGERNALPMVVMEKNTRITSQDDKCSIVSLRDNFIEKQRYSFFFENIHFIVSSKHPHEPRCNVTADRLSWRFECVSLVLAMLKPR